MAVYPVAMVFIVGAVTVLVLRLHDRFVTGFFLIARIYGRFTMSRKSAALVCGHRPIAFEEPQGNTLQLTTELNIHDWIKKGYFLFHAAMYQEAITAFSIAIELDLTFPLAYFNRAATYYKLGNKKQAEKNLQIAAKLGYKKAQEVLKSKF